MLFAVIALQILAPLEGGPVDLRAFKLPNDPLEGVNRRMYNINNSIDDAIIRPVSKDYSAKVPRTVRVGIHNFAQNWSEPSVFVNDTLQLRMFDAGRTLYRFGVNTIVGVAGLIDVADHTGIAHHNNNFGLTLGRYGASSGPYVFLPLAGPTTVRGVIGEVVDFITDPVTQINRSETEALETLEPVATAAQSSWSTTMATIDARSSVDGEIHDLSITSLDPYATLRSAYLQQLAAEVSGEAISMDASPDIPDVPSLADPKSDADKAQSTSRIEANTLARKTKSR